MSELFESRTEAGSRNPSSQPVTLATNHADPRLEDYLDHVCAPLVGVVPYARRVELRAELRAHLEALVATHEELGSLRDLPVVMALRQFGHPRDLARQWAREWEQGTSPRRVQPAWRAMLVALGSFGLASVLTLGSLMIGAQSSFIQVNLQSYLMVVMILVLVLLPLLAGLSTGLLAPARHALGSFYALALLILPSAALATASVGQPPEISSVGDSGLMLALAQCIFWMPIGCGAAVFGGWLRARMALRPGPWVLQ